MDGFMKVVRDLALLVARIVAGVVLVAHGWHRWQVAGLETQVELLRDAGLPAVSGLAVLTILFEVVGGTLLVFGLGTPLIGLGMVVMNVATILTTKAGSGFYQFTDGWEYNLVLAALGLLLLVFGSGRLGLDPLFRRPPRDEQNLIGEAP